MPIDFNLYKKFWALQDYFRNPTQCYTAAAWKPFTDVSLHVTVSGVCSPVVFMLEILLNLVNTGLLS